MALLAPHLAAAGTVVAPDLPGFGHSHPHGWSGSVPHQLEALEAVMDVVAPNRPVVVVGSSLGGRLAISLAARCPDQVAGVVLLAPALPFVVGDPPAPQAALRFLIGATPVLGSWMLARRTARLSPEAQLDETLELTTADPDRIDPAWRVSATELLAMRRDHAWAQVAPLQATASIVPRVLPTARGIWQDLARVSAPGLVIQGAVDRLVRPAATARIARRQPQWRYLRLPAVGHLPALEAPELVAAQILAWRDGGPLGGRDGAPGGHHATRADGPRT